MNGKGVAQRLLERSWTRDRARRGPGDSLVYVAASGTAPAPRRGGVEGLAFSADGRFTATAPGPGDRPATRSGRWHVDGSGNESAVLDFDDGGTRAVVECVGPAEIALSLLPDRK